jgi:Zn-dependent protease with chaperone function
VDFFARQEQSRRTSRVLVGMFLLAFAVVALATTIVVAAALRMYTENNALFLGTESWQQWLDGHRGLVALVAGGTLALMGLASLYRAATLARGGGQVARMLGATEVSGEGSDPLQRRLINVVEEMALASGLPVPEIYVLEQEAGINAFAAGLSPTNAAIAVTRGALEQLERAELQGVIAHEFSHILHGDMRLNQQLIGLSFGILVLSLAGRWLLRSARYTRRGRNGGGVAAAVAIGAALTAIGAIGVLCSRLIKAAVSRQRERLADAAGVQFTREPEGLAGALKKIAGYTGRFTSVDTEEVAHMLFEHGSRFSGWLATHPPLLERIRTLDPSFDPRDLPPPRAPLQRMATRTTPNASGPIESFAPMAPASQLLDRAGEIDAPEVGSALRAAVPDEIYHATRSRDASFLLVLALALGAREPTRQRQLGLIENQLGATRTALCGRLYEDLNSVNQRLRLPILELALPALKQRPGEQLTYLFELLGRMRALDTEQQLFDFVLQRVLEAYLRAGSHAPLTTRAAAGSRPTRQAAVRTLLANVAAFGHSDAVAARSAYDAGLTAVGWPPETGPEPRFDPPAAMRNLDELDAALRELAALRPRDKQRILVGVVASIRADRTVKVEEYELLRAIAATLDCPLPPGSSVHEQAP